MSWAILREFLRNPRNTGAIASSSPALGRMIVSEIGLSSAANVVEYGPGTGVFTAEILAAKRPEAGLCVIENSPKLASRFRRRHPDVTLFEDSAENAPKLLRRIDMPEVDCVICGLPWAAFDDATQDKLLAATLSILRNGGKFATFAYLHGLLLRAGQQFRKKLAARFSRVEKSPVVWRNLPPALVYRCTK